MHYHVLYCTILRCTADSRYLRILSRGSRSSSSYSVTNLLASSGISFTLRKTNRERDTERHRERERRRERKKKRVIEDEEEGEEEKEGE